MGQIDGKKRRLSRALRALPKTVARLGVSGLSSMGVGVGQAPSRAARSARRAIWLTMTRWNGVTVEEHKLKTAQFIASSQ